MFSGIVQELGRVCFLESKKSVLILGVQCSSCFLDALALGCSVAVDGVCLTLTRKESDKIFFDVIPETLACTTIGERVIGDRVNLENSLRLGDPIGGHIVSGHVGGTGKIVAIKENYYHFQVSLTFAPYLFHKGFIAIDGISLTLVSVENERFSVGLIPETLQRTTLGWKGVGSLVNIEVDMSTKVQVDTLRRLSSLQA
ncbi:riboflavin synthase subunit alpha [Chlamydia sp. 17-3921]|uniref:riboflavin synthase subunit alpha n=1 Tax=Chlamydia sp. 17-3921 TaxID=2675798 RepID=UPI0019188CFB|nr:riboflavin synthase subunit alpha [Chlamydia sp. 17-3921]